MVLPQASGDFRVSVAQFMGKNARKHKCSREDRKKEDGGEEEEEVLDEHDGARRREACREHHDAEDDERCDNAPFFALLEEEEEAHRAQRHTGRGEDDERDKSEDKRKDGLQSLLKRPVRMRNTNEERDAVEDGRKDECDKENFVNYDRFFHSYLRLGMPRVQFQGAAKGNGAYKKDLPFAELRLRKVSSVLQKSSRRAENCAQILLAAGFPCGRPSADLFSAYVLRSVPKKKTAIVPGPACAPEQRS